MQLPDFLVIGAAKSGSTTLYYDLCTHPDIFLSEKERSGLLRDLHVDEYAQRFRSASPEQICGDISTYYSMLPGLPGAAERARRFLPAPPKVIYLVRNPIKRAISFHYHMHRWKGADKMSADADYCLREHALLIDTSRYAFQLRPWVDYVGLENIYVVRFEDYVQRRLETANRMCAFLGVSELNSLDDSVVLNRGDGRPVLDGVLLSLREWRPYRLLVRPLISLPMRERIRAMVLPSSPPRPAPPAAGTIDFLVDKLQADVEELRRMLGHAQPLWDLEETRRKLRLATSSDSGENTPHQAA